MVRLPTFSANIRANGGCGPTRGSPVAARSEWTGSTAQVVAPQLMLEFRELTVRYGSGHNLLTAVDGVTIAVPPGKTLGLVGESGSGKSTLAKAAVGLIPVAGGQILLD